MKMESQLGLSLCITVSVHHGGRRCLGVEEAQTRRKEIKGQRILGQSDCRQGSERHKDLLKCLILYGMRRKRKQGGRLQWKNKGRTGDGNEKQKMKEVHLFGN